MTLWPRLQESQFLRFAVIGGVGFLVNEAALYGALHFLKFDPYSAGLVAFLITVSFTWGGNRLLTFPSAAAKRILGIFKEWFRFVAANALGFCVNYAVYAALVTFALTPLNNPYIALAIGTLTGLIFNFTLSKHFVFRAG